MPPEPVNIFYILLFHLIENIISGTISSEYGTMVTLNILVTQHNPLTGTIPEERYYIYDLHWLNLWFYFLTGDISAKIGNLENQREFYTKRRNSNGNIPT